VTEPQQDPEPTTPGADEFLRQIQSLFERGPCKISEYLDTICNNWGWSRVDFLFQLEDWQDEHLLVWSWGEREDLIVITPPEPKPRDMNHVAQERGTAEATVSAIDANELHRKDPDALRHLSDAAKPAEPPRGAENWDNRGPTEGYQNGSGGWHETPDNPDRFAAAISKIPLSLAEWKAREIPPADFICGDWLTTTSRTLMVAPTGIGKTMFTLAIAFAIASGSDFLHWRGIRPARVLFIDGEMSLRLLRQRLNDEEKRCGYTPENLYVLSHDDIEGFSPLNTADGQAQVEAVINRIGGVDIILLDNIMSLIAGDMKDEEPWRQTLPCAQRLTKRRIGQIWVHHTGHDESRSYGTKTREWQMDTVIRLESVDNPQTDVSFKLSFSKARERTPATRADFLDKHISLVDDQWLCGGENSPTKIGAKTSPMAAKFLAALRDATIGTDTPKMNRRPTATFKEWTEECISQGLIERDAKPNITRANLSKYKLQLISANLIACNETSA
jgi:hypothetical protein